MVPRPQNCRTPRNREYVDRRGAKLLVARPEEIRGQLRQGMCRMLKYQAEYRVATCAIVPHRK
jgi:hypothetical protein